jgi:twitching motility two-component system response regulator PilG
MDMDMDMTSTPAHPGSAGHGRAGRSRQLDASRALRVLLADAGQTVRQRMGEMLRQQGFDVVTADDGFEVLCRLPELRPDLLLMSLALPRLSGTQVCSLIRQSPDFRSLAVVLLSEDGNLLDQARAELAGADSCLAKPFRLAELLDVIERLQPRDDTVPASEVA